MIWVQQKAFTSSLPIFMLSTTHIHACLSGAVSVHSSSPANTFQLSLSLQSMQSLCLKTPLSVQLECSLYKRHPSTSLEWFLFAVHLSSVCHRFFSDSHCLAAANFGPPNKTWKTLEMKWHDCFPLKCNQALDDEFLFSISLPFAPVLPVSAVTNTRF